MYKIIMTGGGSAGHVTPNIALIPKLREKGFEVKYIGGKNGIEKDIIKKENIPYYEVSTGKLRRYFDLKNFTDPFKVGIGIIQCTGIMRKEKPNIVFSKGGFVSVPVVIGAYLNRIPVVSHESDMTPGLANRLIMPYCTRLCVTFPESLKHIKGDKGVVTGTPIREELFKGNKDQCLKITGFSGRKPILLIIGGSLGSHKINESIRGNLEALLKDFDIIHLCGKGNVEESLRSKRGYKQYEYVTEEMPHFLAGCDVAISRAGANSIFELLALKKPMLLIPLSKKSSRGDQILNAQNFKNNRIAKVILQDDLNYQTLKKGIEDCLNLKDILIKNMSSVKFANGNEKIIKLIAETAKNNNK